MRWNIVELSGTPGTNLAVRCWRIQLSKNRSWRAGKKRALYYMGWSERFLFVNGRKTRVPKNVRISGGQEGDTERQRDVAAERRRARSPARRRRTKTAAGGDWGQMATTVRARWSKTAMASARTASPVSEANCRRRPHARTSEKSCEWPRESSRDTEAEAQARARRREGTRMWQVHAMARRICVHDDLRRGIEVVW